MRSKPEVIKGAASRAESSEDIALHDRLSADLQSRGLSVAAADMLVSRVLTDLEGRSGSGLEATLDGVALGFLAQAGVAGELQEIERLMGSFAGELSKLDEVLEVLAAYLRRMRTTADASGSRILH